MLGWLSPGIALDSDRAPLGAADQSAAAYLATAGATVTLGIAGSLRYIVAPRASITADAVREMRLKKGDIAAALVKSTEVMIVIP